MRSDNKSLKDHQVKGAVRKFIMYENVKNIQHNVDVDHIYSTLSCCLLCVWANGWSHFCIYADIFNLNLIKMDPDSGRLVNAVFLLEIKG